MIRRSTIVLADLREMTRHYLFRKAFCQETGQWLGLEVQIGAERPGTRG